MRSLKLTYILAHVVVTGLGLSCHGQVNFNVKRTFSETGHEIVFSSFSPDGQYILTVGSDSSLIVWNADRGTIYRTLSGLNARPNAALITKDNRFILAAGKDEVVTMWDLERITSTIFRTFSGHTDNIKSLDLSPDGSMLASGSADGSVRVWDITNANLLFELNGHKKDVNVLVFSPMSDLLVSGGADGTLVLWDMRNGSKHKSIKAHKGWIRDLEISPGGSILASCGDDKLIKTWEFPGFGALGTMKGHKDWVQCIDFSPDGKTLISGGRDKQVMFWDVNSQDQVAHSQKLRQIVTSVDISPVGSDFISSCYGLAELDIWAITGLDQDQWEHTVSMTANPASTEMSASPEEARSSIELFSPVPLEGRVVHQQNSIDLVGRVSDPEGISVFLINKVVVELPESGVFQLNYQLVQGDNIFEMVVVNGKGKMNQMDLVVECRAADAMTEGEVILSEAEGKYYALMIGVNDYKAPDIADLDHPIQDAMNLYHVLVSKYSFEEENMVLLENPTQAELIMTLDGLTDKLTSNDKLLIFYAGHGYWDERGKVGYWFPSDASRNSTVNWFRNSTLRDYIGSIETRHILLIADACFSGAIFKTRGAFSDAPRGIEKLNQLPSRKAMTSGVLEEVPDESMFIQFLVKRLEENEETYLPSELLFSSFKTAVMNNSETVPQYGVIQNVGDEGGDFIFVRSQ